MPTPHNDIRWRRQPMWAAAEQQRMDPSSSMQTDRPHNSKTGRNCGKKGTVLEAADREALGIEPSLNSLWGNPGERTRWRTVVGTRTTSSKMGERKLVWYSIRQTEAKLKFFRPTRVTSNRLCVYRFTTVHAHARPTYTDDSNKMIFPSIMFCIIK